MIPFSHIKTLRMICACLENKDVHWALTGSMNMAIQGLPIEVHDIDIQTDEVGAYAMETLFSEYVVTPVRYLAFERMRSHLGKLLINGVEVEIIGALQKLLPDGIWEAPVDMEAHTCLIGVDDMLVPGLTLVYEHQAYVMMGRLKKAELLRQWLEKMDKS